MRKSTENINWVKYSSPLWLLLTVLSLFSSCTVRKGLQASLEVPVTKQLNPSKATTNQLSACHFVDIGENLIFTINKENSETGFPQQTSDHKILPEIQFLRSDEKTLSGWPLTLKIESYILYNQMKSCIYG